MALVVLSVLEQRGWTRSGCLGGRCGHGLSLMSPHLSGDLGGCEAVSGCCGERALVAVERDVRGGEAGCCGWLAGPGSWSTIRHQRAEAGWSSGSGPAAAACCSSLRPSSPAATRLATSRGHQRRLAVVGGARGKVGDELKQRRASFRGAGGEAPVELRLPGTARAVRDGGSGSAAIAARRPGSPPATPQRRRPTSWGQLGMVGCPRWAVACRVEANSVGEIGDQLRSCLQVGTPLRVVTEGAWGPQAATAAVRLVQGCRLRGGSRGRRPDRWRCRARASLQRCAVLPLGPLPLPM